MVFFHNDYNRACHPAILERLMQSNAISMDSYGTDSCCREAGEKIRRLCGNPDLGVHFLVGGTQTNLTIIDGALRSYQAVIGAETAHINVHETGAVEGTGHKVLALPSKDGKISAEQVRALMESHRNAEGPEHMAQPKMVYISDSTELGTIYTLRELEALSAVCQEYGLYLFVDGARLGYALTAADNDVTLPDLARLADVFYIGGTKVGAMFGEAVVISNPALKEDFRYLIKQHGGMLAKGWLLGMQFQVLMEDNLYFDIAAHANKMADEIRETLHALKYPLVAESRTNQIFAILPDTLLEALAENYTFSDRTRVDACHSSVRFCTSWATEPESVQGLCAELMRLSQL